MNEIGQKNPFSGSTQMAHFMNCKLYDECLRLFDIDSPELFINQSLPIAFKMFPAK